MCFNIIAVVGALFRRWSLGVNFQRSPAAVPSYDQQQLGLPWDSGSLGVNSQQTSAVSNPLLGSEDEDNSDWVGASELNFQQSPAGVSYSRCHEELGSPWDSWSLGVNSQQTSAVSNPFHGFEDEDNSETIICREIAELSVELNLPPESLTIDHSDWGVADCAVPLSTPWDSWSPGVNSQQRSALSDPEDEDDSEMIIYREIAELCVELNLPPENLTIDHSDWGLPEILSHLKKLKANKEAGHPSSQLSIHFIYEVPEELLPLKQKKANIGKNILFSAISKISKRFK